MNKIQFVVACLFIFVFANAAAQDSVIIIRHGEKPAKGDNLNCKGLNRSLAIPAVLNTKISVPVYTYVPSVTTGKNTKHSRMFQTVTPYAVQHNLEINSAFEKTDSAGVAKDVEKKLSKHTKGTILMVWEHGNIPRLARALGVPASKVPHWDDNDFDSIWIITNAGKATAALSIDHEGLNGVSDQCPVVNP